MANARVSGVSDQTLTQVLTPPPHEGEKGTYQWLYKAKQWAVERDCRTKDLIPVSMAEPFFFKGG